jgi:predicted GNAT superfamily acetyltransferase
LFLPDEAEACRVREPDRVTSTAPPQDRPADDAVAHAQSAAAQAASKAGIGLLPLDTLAGVREAAALFCRVWRADATTPPLPAEVMRAVEHAGGYVVGAYLGTDLVGASSGFLGLDGSTPVLHSHISGVSRPGRGIGLALKLHQRAWALERRIASITWTFDPLVRRNAWFNLAKLGAVGVEYLVDFYGPMTDGVNGGESSDRLFTRWDLLAEPAPAAPDGAPVVLAEHDGRPQPGPTPADAARLLVQLPADVESLRRTDPDLARCWRLAVREALVPAFADGFRADGITRDGCLVLGR